MWTPSCWPAEALGWQTDGHTRDLEIRALGGQAKEGIAVVRDAREYSLDVYSLIPCGLLKPHGWLGKARWQGVVGGEGSGLAAHTRVKAF